MKKKTKKLNELSLLQREKKKQSVGELEDWGWRSGLGVHGRSSTPPHSPESLIHGAVPADKGAGGEEEEPEQRQSKARAAAGVHTEPGQAGEEVQEKGQSAA